MWKKKTAAGSVSHHFVRKGFIAAEWKTTYIITKLNLADNLTKNPPVDESSYRKVSVILLYIFPKIEE